MSKLYLTGVPDPNGGKRLVRAFFQTQSESQTFVSFADVNLFYLLINTAHNQWYIMHRYGEIISI